MRFITTMLMGLMLVVNAWAAGVDKFPENKWFNNGKGLEEAMEIQKATGADMFVYFANYGQNDQEGLCRWWEKRGMSQPEIAKMLKEYVKVKLTYPLGKKDLAMVESYKVNKCPAIFVVPPNGRSKRIMVFDWPNGKPELKDIPVIAELIRTSSTPKAAAPAAP